MVRHGTIRIAKEEEIRQLEIEAFKTQELANKRAAAYAPNIFCGFVCLAIGVFVVIMATFEVGRVVFIVKALLVAAAVLPALVGIWAILGAVPRSVRSRYPGRVMYMAQLPFTEEWRRHVNPEDLPTIVRARRRQFVFALSFVLLTHLIAASAYLNVVAQLYCCQIADLSRPDPALQSRGRSRRQVIRRTEAVFATDRGRDGLLFSRWGSGQEQGRGEAW